MAYTVPAIKAIPRGTPNLNHLQYGIGCNSHGLTRISFAQENREKLVCKMIYQDRDDGTLKFDFTKPECGEDIFVKDIQFHNQRYISYAAWNDCNSLELTVIYIETPYVVTYSIEFEDEKIKLSFHMNGSINLQDFSALGMREG